MKRPLSKLQLHHQALQHRLLQILLKSDRWLCANDLKDELGESRQCTNGLLTYLYSLKIVAMEPKRRRGSRRPLQHYRLVMSEDEAQQIIEERVDHSHYDEQRFVTEEDLAWMEKYREQAQQRLVNYQTLRT
jgi:hypothetical protein